MRGKKTKTKRTTISLTSTNLKKLRELANKERRPVSRQIIYMMEFYQKKNKQNLRKEKYVEKLQMYLLWTKIQNGGFIKKAHNKIWNTYIKSTN